MIAQTEVSGKTNSPQKSSLNGWMIIFAAFTVLGIVCWIIQLNKGLQMTNLSVINMWGLYITFFMIFTGVAAGSVFFASVPYLFNLEEYKPYCRIATYVGAIASIVAASLFIIVDIGNPDRAWEFITSGNITSPMFITTYLLINGCYHQQTTRNDSDDFFCFHSF